MLKRKHRFTFLPNTKMYSNLIGNNPYDRSPSHSTEKTIRRDPQKALWTARDPISNKRPVGGGRDRPVLDVAEAGELLRSSTLLCPFQALLSPLGGLEGL